MLAKLLKHEFIATGRIMGALYAAYLVLAAYILGSYAIHRDTATTGQMIGVVLLVFVSMCSFILTVVVMVSNFQKSLYGDQGYLSFTLPVKGSSLLFSKILTSIVWFTLAFACFLGSMAIFYMVIKEDLIGAENYQTIETLLPILLDGKSISEIITTCIISLVSFFIEFAALTLGIYFSISLANTRFFQKRYSVWTVVFMFAIFGIMSKLSTLISDNLDLYVTISSISFNIVNVLVYLVFGVVFYFVTFWLMNKKINIR